MRGGGEVLSIMSFLYHELFLFSSSIIEKDTLDFLHVRVATSAVYLARSSNELCISVPNFNPIAKQNPGSATLPETYQELSVPVELLLQRLTVWYSQLSSPNIHEDL